MTMMAEANRQVAPVPSEPPMNGGLSGPALDEIADRLIHAAKRGTPVRLDDVRRLVLHMHSTEAYAALRLSAYTNNALGLELLSENRTMREALKYALPIVERYGHTQGDNAEYHAELTAPIRAALGDGFQKAVSND